MKKIKLKEVTEKEFNAKIASALYNHIVSEEKIMTVDEEGLYSYAVVTTIAIFLGEEEAIKRTEDIVKLVQKVNKKIEELTKNN